MNAESTVMEWLDPPEQGLRELKGKIAGRASRHKIAVSLAAAAVVVALTSAIVHDGMNPAVPGAPAEDEWQAAIAASEQALIVIDGAAVELSAPEADTRIYLVSTLPQPTRPGTR